MTRPEIIRADSIDLQAHNNPSAKDHTRQPTHPSPLGTGPPAPHQAEALRELHDEIAEQQNLSPRVSQEWSHENQHYDDDGESDVEDHEHDNLAVAQNGGMNGSHAEDGDLADAEGDEDDDDDMMDKISSSPSIDDGGYSLPAMWPSRNDSLSPTHIQTSPTFSPSEGDRSSSSFMETPVHFPLGYMAHDSDDSFSQPTIKINHHHHHHHHHSGEYTSVPTESTMALDGRNEEDRKRARLSTQRSPIALIDTYDQDFDITDHEIDDAINIAGEHSDIEQQTHDLLSDNLERAPTSENRDKIITIRSCHLGTIPNLTPPRSYQDVDYSPGGAMTIPYESSEDEEEDDDDDFEIADEETPHSPSFVESYVDSGWAGESLQELEDIDFEFVYALHTFVATVEGQANATKGDTMVLLDDSNSYWWLVRVVKDSSIGYLPAEHIETPTERLARLNKHRNIDLSATMLQDQAEKSKNPLKKAIRRRNTKTVQFAAPTYVEASDNDYSSEEEDEEIGGQYYGQESQAAESQMTEDEKITVEPLRTKAEIREVASEDLSGEGPKISSDTARTSDEIFDGKGTSRSRNGTVRNTDSFFKDDSVETRKITLTPNLLRDDSLTSTVRTSDDFNKDLQKRPSLDKLEKEGSFEKSRDGEKRKKEKKEKEKKPGMLSGLFKRKDKKSKGDFKDEDIDEIIMGKRSNENQRESQESNQKSSDEFDAPKESEEAKSQQASQAEKAAGSKLQKRGDVSPPKLAGVQPVASVRAVPPEAQHEPAESAPVMAPVVAPAEMEATEPVQKITSPIEEPTREAPVPFVTAPQRPTIPGAFPDSYISTPATEHEVTMDPERLSESPVHIESEDHQNQLPALVVDTSSQEETSSPASSPSPELVDVNEARQSKGSEGGASTSTLTPTWNDAHLRTFFEDDGEIRDLMVVVYDNSGVVPAGPDHPVTGKLFKEENAKLADITSRLDGMLGDWLARKSRPQVASR